jgi:formylglycine-generating enzyme
MRSLQCLPTLLVFGVLLMGVQAHGQAVRRAAKPASKRWALLIGVEDYVRLEKLHYCGADMRALREQLTRCGFPKRQITLLEDTAADNRYRPFKSSIEDQFDQALKMVERDDLLLVAFSGHGVSIKGKSYLCPVDTKLTDADSMICVETLYERLSKCPAALKVVLVDACRDDPRLGGDKSAASAPDQRELAATLERPPEGIYCLTSCSPGERSKEDPKLGHGVFMHFVLDGLRGAADTRNRGKVSLEDLCRYARDETKFYVREKFNDIQRPYYRIESSDDFDIAQVAIREITNSIGMKLVLIPAGEFMMGSGESAEATAAYFKNKYSMEMKAAEGFNKEHPQHRVRISKPFYLGTYHVTRSQFRQFVSDSGYRTDAEKDGKGGYGYNGKKYEQKPEYTWRNAGFEQTDEHPVVNVSWNDATAFCQWLSRKEGKTYRLPTEAEWEYACRAGTTTRWWCGDDAEGLSQVANVADATAKAKFPDREYTIRASDGYVFTSPVGSFRANAFGLYDMHGNVMQWCADWYDEEYYSRSPADDPTGPNSDSFRVLRGGSWNYWAFVARSADRFMSPPGAQDNDAGFRIARTP